VPATEGMPVPQVGGDGGADAGPGTVFVDNGGPVLANIHVQLIFWGTAWTGNITPSAAQITNAVSSILAGEVTKVLSFIRANSVAAE